jgi:hypothetical protein
MKEPGWNRDGTSNLQVLAELPELEFRHRQKPQKQKGTRVQVCHSFLAPRSAICNTSALLKPPLDIPVTEGPLGIGVLNASPVAWASASRGKFLFAGEGWRFAW